MHLFGSNKRAVGSIIGGAIIMLILLSGYVYWFENNRTQIKYQNLLTEMNELDRDTVREDLDFEYGDADDSSLKHLYVVNNGPITTHVIYMGIFEKTESGEIEFVEYRPCDLFLEPAASMKLSDAINTAEPPIEGDIPDTGTNAIQFVTEKGNTFIAHYIPSTYQVKIDVRALAKVMGYFIIDYESFEWTTIEPDGQINEWNQGWDIDIEQQDYLIFKVDVTYYGPFETNTQLGGESRIKIGSLDQGVENIAYYIVKYDSGTETVSTFDDDNLNYLFEGGLDDGDPGTICFAVKGAYKDPLDSQNRVKVGEGDYSTIIGFYDVDMHYAQSIPFIAIKVR